jgi:hypothetical protein
MHLCVCATYPQVTIHVRMRHAMQMQDPIDCFVSPRLVRRGKKKQAIVTFDVAQETLHVPPEKCMRLFA